MKLRKILMGLAAVVGFTTAATAATPVAVWDGDFSKTIEGYTLNLNGNTEEGGVITIDQAQGVTVNASAMANGMTVLFKYSDLDLTSSRTNVIATSQADADSNDLTGVYIDANLQSHGIWKTTGTYDAKVTTQGTMTSDQTAGKFAFTYKAGGGTQLYRLADGNRTTIYNNTTLHTTNSGNPKGCAVGGPRGSTFTASTGMKVYAIAIFDKVLTEAEMKAYQFPSEIKEYYATLDGHVYEWTDLDGKWNPKMPAEGFSATDTLVITNEANQSFFMDKDVTALKLKFVSSPDAPALQLTADEEVSLAIGTYDFSEAESKTTIKYGMTASVVAGKDTVLEKANNPSLTIAEGNKLTVKYPDGGTAPTLKASKISNAGTLHFMGGTEESPIYIDGGVEAGLGTITLAEDTYVKQDDKGTATKYTITGSGVSSFFTVARNSTGAPGMKAGSSFADVIVGSAATASGKEYWLEHATIADTVGLNLTGNLKLSDLTPNPVVIRSLTGTYNLAVYDKSPVDLTICCKEDANFAGTSGIPITIGEGEGTQTFSGAFNKALTVEEGGQVKLTGSAQPSSIAVEGAVYVDPNGAAMTITGAITGEGTIYVTDSSEEGLGSVAFTGDRSGFTGMIIYTRGLYDIGTARVLDIPEGIELQEGVNIAATQSHDEFGRGADTTITGLTDGMLVVLTKLDGTTETLTAEDGEVTFPGSGMPKIDGAATLFDVTFTNFVWDMSHQNNGFFSYKGVAGALLKYDTPATFANTNGEAQVKDIGVYIKHHPYIGEAAKALNGLGDFTGVFVGEMSPTANRIFVYFGSTLSSNQGIMIATLAEKDAVGVFSNVGSTLTELTELSVPNAATARHVYILTKKEVEGNTIFTIYLDGVKRAEKTIAGKFELGSSSSCGVQVGADFGGQIRKGTYKAVDNVESETGVLNVCRIYDYLLTDDQVEALTTEYPYESEGGLYTRTIAGEVDYAATATWAKSPSTTPEYDVPTGTEKFSPSATLTASADAVVTVNTNSEIDVFTFNGSAMSFVKDAEGTNKLAVGTAVINAPITIEYGALDLSKASVSLAGNGAVTFDLAKFPLGSFFASTKIQMTGLTDRNDTKITVDNIPESEGREAELLFEDGVYNLVITVEDLPFVYNMGWTWNDEDVTAEIVSNNTAVAVEVQSNLEWPIDRSDITVEAGTLTATAVTKRAAGVTVKEGAVLDLNGNQAKEMALTLNGGKVTYGNTKLGEADQIKVLTLTANSEINTPVKGQIYAQSYNTATTIALDTYTLTKTGTDILQVVNTDITGTGTIDIQEGEFYGSENTRATNVTFKIADGATLHNRGGKTMTIAKIVGEGGTLNNEGTISTFTLTGTLNIANGGTYGTITNAAGAVVNVGKKRGLVFAGAGTVNVTLTDAEYAAGQVTLFTLADEATTAVGTVMYNDVDITDKCTISGGQITAIAKDEAKIGDVYYPTLAAALDAAAENDQIELLKNVTFAPNGKYTLDKTIYLTLGGFNLTGNGATTFEVVNNAALYVTATDSTVSALRINVGRATNDNGSLFISGGTWTIDNNAIIHVNGTCKSCTVVTQDADFTSNGDNAIQFCGAGTFSIDGGTITGATAVYVKAGTLSIAADLVANGEKKPYVYSANGANATGDALVIDNCGYPEGPATVSLLEGTTLTSAHAEKMGYYVYNSSPEGTVTKDATVDVNTPEGYLWKDGTTLTKAEAKIGTTYYLTLQEALNVGGDVVMLKDVAKEVTVPADKTVNLDFNGFAITTTSRQAINNYGRLTVTNGNVTAQESAIVLWGESVTTISGGTYTSKDNAVIAGNGNAGQGDVALHITGGTFNGGITTAGYIACGIYVPNSGTYTISGGQFNITGGCGVCARAGEIKVASEAEFNLGGSAEPGKVGDCTNLVPCVSMYIDYGAGYPGHAETDYLKAKDNTLSTADTQTWVGPDGEGYYTLTVKTGPQPVPGSPTEVDPVPGEENTYIVTPTGTTTDLAVQGAKDGDTFIINGVSVTSLTLDNNDVTVTVMNGNGNVDITGAVYGWNEPKLTLKTSSANETYKFSTELDPEQVGLAVNGITVGANVDVAVTSYVGLTYTLVRSETVGGEGKPVTGSAQVAAETTTTLTDTGKLAGQAFYKVKVTK